MSWRLDLRPASFRGAAFEVRRNRKTMRRRGVHHTYPKRDEGWVEELGLDDARFSVTAYVIGDDYARRRDALEAALEEAGAGTLIHPTRGAVDVVVDPNAGYSVDETSREGRMAVFSITFLRARDTGSYPSSATDGIVATAAAADAMSEGALDVFGQRFDLSGAQAFIDDLDAAFADVFSAFDGARALIAAGVGLQRNAAGVVFNAVADAQAIAAEFLSVGDAASATIALFDAAAGVFGARRRRDSSLSLPGIRPPAPRPGRRRDRLTAAKTATAVRVTLDKLGGAATSRGARFTANRIALDAAAEAALIAELARAVTEEEHSGREAAISAMKDLDVRIETAILREADRADTDDGHVNRLTALRAASRDALLATAADLAPLIRADLGRSLPALAASWTLTAGVAAEAELIDRNQIDHPLFAPAALDYRRAA